MRACVRACVRVCVCVCVSVIVKCSALPLEKTLPHMIFTGTVSIFVRSLLKHLQAIMNTKCKTRSTHRHTYINGRKRSCTWNRVEAWSMMVNLAKR